MASRNEGGRARAGAIVIWAAVLIVVVVGMIAFGVDVGMMMLTRTELQVAADASAMAAAPQMFDKYPVMFATADQFAAYHDINGQPIHVQTGDVQYGSWDMAARTFTPTSDPSNAVRVIARANNVGLFFGRIWMDSYSSQASAVAMANPRDICFVIDLSGSMNDDTEPGWATSVVNSKFAPEGYPLIGSQLMQDVYKDFGFGAFPGVVQYIGQPLGIPSDQYAYAELTKDASPLASSSVPPQYRIASADDEATRKRKAYSWIIDFQIAKVMPKALPAPSSASNYAYWEKYIDYLAINVSVKPTVQATSGGTSSSGGGKSMGSKTTGGGKTSGGKSGGGGSAPSGPKAPPTGMILPRNSQWFAAWELSPFMRAATRTAPLAELTLAVGPGDAWQEIVLPELAMGAASMPGQPPNNRGVLPPNRYAHRIDSMNNPNTGTFPTATNTEAKGLRNYVGYLTYVQFMMDHGRDQEVTTGVYTPLSTKSPYCPYHSESTPGGTFSFPPRAQPEHAARRSLIAAMQVVKDRNNNVPNKGYRDWVSVVTYDSLSKGGPVVAQPLTGDYDKAMQACTKLQASTDVGASTATESGMIAAYKHIASPDDGGSGRRNAEKVVVLVTDGVPNLYESPDSTISQYMSTNPSPDYFGGGYYWYDAALMQSALMKAKKWDVYPVGLGLGTDYNFMDKMARLGGTADKGGASKHGSGNPAEYEQRLTEIFEEIISSPQVRLVD